MSLSLNIEHELVSDGDGGERGVYEVYLIRWQAFSNTNEKKLVATFYSKQDAELYKSSMESAKLVPFLIGE